MRAIAVLLVFFTTSDQGAGQSWVQAIPSGSAQGLTKAGANCNGGIRNDDGQFEFGLGFAPTVGEGRYVSRFLLPGTVNRIDAVCVCLTRKRGSTQDAFSGALEIWSDAGAGGPGTLLGSFPASFTGVQDIDHAFTFYRVNIPQHFLVAGTKAYIGLAWKPSSGAGDLYVCGDQSDAADLTPAYTQGDGGEWIAVWDGIAPAVLGVRAEVNDAAVPDGPWLTTKALPGFRFKARFTSGLLPIAGIQETDCLPETLCVSGAVRGRTELFVRIIGPRPNGFLWSNIVKFTVSQVEIWIEQLGTSQLRYYKLPAVGPADTSLPGLVDRQGFEP
jgi:hypothetical protein